METPTVLQSGEHSAFTGETYRDVHDQAGLEALWRAAFAGQVPPPEMPRVDFSRQMVLGLFLGQKTHGGYAVHVQDVEASGAAVDVHFTILIPGRGCQATQVLVQPYQIVAAPASLKPVRFFPATQDRNC